MTPEPSFGALEHGAWAALTNSYEVVLPQIVMNEIQFYVSRETGEKVYVDPQEWIEEGKVQAFQTTVTDVASVGADGALSPMGPGRLRAPTSRCSGVHLSYRP